MLKISNIDKSFDGKYVLENINIKVRNNEIVGILGPNGAGKTTLIKVINQLINPDSGSVLIDGASVSMGKINVVFEGARNMYWPLSVKENYYYLSSLKGIFKKEVDEILKDDKYVFINHFLNRRFGKLSLGQKQIVSVAGAFLSSPDVMCLDEPSNGLDIKYQNELVDFIKKMSKRGNLKILISSHDINFLYDVVDRFIIINDGSIADEFNKNNLLLETIIRKYSKIFETGV